MTPEVLYNFGDVRSRRSAPHAWHGEDTRGCFGAPGAQWQISIIKRPRDARILEVTVSPGVQTVRLEIA